MKKFIFLFLFFVGSLEACSCFMVQKKDHVLAAKNYDWNIEEGLVVVNKSGIKKKGIIDPHPLTWVSKFGSVTFNQYGREFPMGGMNEKGLVVEILWLADSQYPKIDEREGLSELQWIQYQLDTAKNIDDVIESSEIVRLSEKSLSSVHFMIADRRGEAATIEFLDGKMVVHRTPEMKLCAITNDCYAQSMAFLRGKEVKSKDKDSLKRFQTLSQFLPKLGDKTRKCFGLLKKVARPDTQWSIVYDLRDKKVTFCTRSRAKKTTIDMKKLDFSPRSQVYVLKMKEPKRFLPYTKELNRELIDISLDQTPFLKGLPVEFREALSSYPDSTFPESSL